MFLFVCFWSFSGDKVSWQHSKKIIQILLLQPFRENLLNKNKIEIKNLPLVYNLVSNDKNNYLYEKL